MQFRPLVLSAALTLVAIPLAACSTEPVAWQDRTEMPDRHPSPLTYPTPLGRDSAQNDTTSRSDFARTQDLLREAGATSVVNQVLSAMPEAAQSIPSAPMPAMPPMTSTAGAAALSTLGHGDEPADSARCARSLRIVSAPSNDPARARFAAWWSRKSNGRVALVGAWQANGDTSLWHGPINIDTLDQGAGDANASERGAVGCNRAAPGLAIDEKNGYVHVAYAINAPEGPGVFYAHQMDPRSPFEQPVVIVYGDRRLGVVRVASAGDLVAVAYEDPNAPLDHGRVGLAISRSAGHVFEPRVVANRSGWAVDPYVAVKGRAAVIGWTDVDSTANPAASFRLRRAVVR